MTALEVICEDFDDISQDNASFLVLENSIWLLVTYFLTTITFWFVKCLFLIDRCT